MENARYRVLMVEDDKLDQQAFERLVSDENLPYDYKLAGSVSQARSVLASDQFDIVIADYDLGDGTAFDLLDSAKKTPFIIVTGTGDEELAVKAWRAGAYDYLIKDLERSYLKALPVTVDNVLRHKEAEQKVQLLSGAIMSTDDSVYITDMENKIIFVNRAFCKTYGYSKEDVVGKDSNVLWIGKLQAKDTRSVFQIARSAWEVGFYHRKKDGSVFPVSLSRSIIRDGTGNEIAVVGVVRDISEHIAMEEQLKGANQKLQRQNQLKSELAVAVSERLNELIAESEKNISEAMAEQAESGLKEKLESMVGHISSAKDVISDFLEVSNIDTAQTELDKTAFGLHSVVSEVVEVLSPLAAEKNITLESSGSDSEVVVDADRDKISQVLITLLTNSIESVPDNGHIFVRVKQLDDDVTVEVENDGPNVEASELDRIFNRFEQIREQLRDGREELSLGLPVARELIEMHGGCIWAENKEDRGTRFCFTLPKHSPQTVTTTVAAGRSGENHK
jgi:PAS domain S-box-containing protein